jgi:outer membrane protein, heavy metal efflux system
MNKTVHPFLKFLVLWVIALSMGTIKSHAQVYPEQYLQQALENNPGLQAQHKDWEASQQQVDITGTLPDPTLSAGFFTPPMERFMGNQWVDVGLMQMFPWPGTLGKQKSAAEKMAESQYHQYRDERNRLFMEMTRLWLEIYRKEQELKIIERYKEILKSREDIIYTRYEAGQQRSGLTLDIYRLEIQLAALDNREEKIREEHRALVESFNILTGRELAETIETPDTLTVFTPEDFETQPDTESFASNPQLNRAQTATEAAEIQQEVSRLKTRPMLGLGLQYSYFAPGEAAMGQMDGGHMVMPMVSVSLPIFGKRNQATQQQSRCWPRPLIIGRAIVSMPCRHSGHNFVQKQPTCKVTTNFTNVSSISPKKPGNWSSMSMHQAMKALMNCCASRTSSSTWNGDCWKTKLTITWRGQKWTCCWRGIFLNE